jgi:inner membrane transporter RhtA
MAFRLGRWSRTSPVALPVLVLVAAMLLFQTGAAIAKTLLPLIGATGTTALRAGFGSLLLALYWRPWRARGFTGGWRVLVVYGIAMGTMNLLFYASLQRLPLGIAVAIEFTGPLAVAIATSHRGIDFLWVGLAALGLLALLPLGWNADRLDPAGLGFGFGAGACWGIYIVYGKRVGAHFGGMSTALGMLIGAAMLVPVGLVTEGARLFSPAVLPAALAVAVLSSAVPYSMEMFALTRLPTRTFGILMSLDPALGALAGLGFLGEHLTPVQWLAVCSIIGASAGSAATARADASATPLLD